MSLYVGMTEFRKLPGLDLEIKHFKRGEVWVYQGRRPRNRNYVYEGTGSNWTDAMLACKAKVQADEDIWSTPNEKVT